jgi:hypothetical protein
MGNCQIGGSSALAVTVANVEIDPTLNEKVIFTPDEIKIVQRTWAYLDDLKQLGIQLMVTLLTTHPQVKAMFRFSQGLDTEEDLRGNPILAYHGSRIVAVFNNLIQGLENVNSNEYGHLKNLGRSHFSYGTQLEHFKVYHNLIKY